MSGRSTSREAPRAFQFRLATVLVAMVWVGLISLGLRTPTTLWLAMIAGLTLLSVLSSVLIAIYRKGRLRAIAIGFAVFCVGYLTYAVFFTGPLAAGLRTDATPEDGAFDVLYDGIHPDWVEVGPPGLRIGRTRVPPNERHYFLAICHHALACVLGVVGAIAAQVLHATRPADKQPQL